MGGSVNAKSLVGLVLFLGCANSGICFGRPALRLATSPSLQLDEILVEVNGERRLVKAKDGFEVVRGDLMVIKEVWLADRGKVVSVVQLDGYAPKRRDVTNDARGKVVNTAKDLARAGMGSGDGVDYILRASGSGLTYGEMRIHVSGPRLDGVEVTVNGVRKFLRSGDPLRLRATDQIGVQRVLTNVRGNENVKHEMKTSKDANGQETRELRFVRGDDILGQIPIQWQE